MDIFRKASDAWDREEPERASQGPIDLEHGESRGMWYGYEGAESIGALLARVRMERGISQLRLAERLCASAGVATVSRHEISRWEREERIPCGFWLRWLAATLEVPLADLERAADVARWARSRGRPGRRSTRSVPGPVPPNWTEVRAGVYYRRAS